MEENSNKRKKEDEIDMNEVKITQYYKDKEIGIFFETIAYNKGNKIIEELNNYCEIGDWKNSIILMKKLIFHKIFRIFTKEKKIELLDIITKKLIPNIYFYSMQDINIIIEFLANNFMSIPKDYIFDWRQFYSLFYVIDFLDTIIIPKNYIIFYSKIYKYIPEDAITYEDYQIMRKTILDDLANWKQMKAICIFYYFLPEKYLDNDDYLQMKIFNMFKNMKTNFVPSCCLFSKILNHNGKLFFSKDPEKNREYIKDFIDYYFTYLNLYISGNAKVFNFNFVHFIYYEINNKVKFSKSVINILYYLLFNESLKEYSSYVETHLKIILNNNHLYLKERSRDAITKNYIVFLQLFIYKIDKEFNKQIYDKIIERKIRFPKSYKENKYIYDKLLLMLKYFSLNLEKLFLFDNEGACLSQRTLFSLLASAPIDEEYMKQILIYINFENYIKMLQFFKDYSETRMSKFIMKLYSIMPLLLNEYIFSNYQNVRDLIKESIIFLSENVSSANSTIAIDILIIFCYEFFRIKDLSKKNKIYEFLIPIITDATVKIMNNLLRILDLICDKNNIDFNIFIVSMKKFLDKETESQISKTYSNFIQNNEIPQENIEFYFFVLNEEEQNNLFNYIYNSLLFIDKSNNVEINKHFLYQKYDNDFNINISNCSIEIFNENQLKGYRELFSFMNFSKILVNEKMIKKFYELYYALINQKEKKFKKLGYEFFGYAFISLLECNFDEDNMKDINDIPLIEYPNEKNINIALQMYEKIVLPYEKFIEEYLGKNSPNCNIIEKNKDIDKLTLEQILNIYMKLLHKVCLSKCNLILNINFDEVNSEEYAIINNQINLYKKYINLLNNSLNVFCKIFEYNKNNNDKKLFDNHSTNRYLEEILVLKLKASTPLISFKRSFYKSFNDRIYNNHFINNFRDFFKTNRTKIIHIRHFSWIKLLVPKDNFYYSFLNYYLLTYNSVNHPTSFITVCVWDFYSINSQKIKTLYNEMHKIFIDKLENLKNDSLNEQNIMKNIAESYNEFSLFYIILFPYDSLDVIKKIFKIIVLLKNKKFRKLDVFVSLVLNQMKTILKLTKHIDIKNDKIFSKYSKQNEIIGEEMNKIYKIIAENENLKYIKLHSNNIRQFIEIGLNLIFPSEKDINNKKDKIDTNLCQPEIYLVFKLIVDYVLYSIDKKDELYRKVIQIIFNNLIFEKVPVGIRILWIQCLHLLMHEEYSYYQEYEWIVFKSEEEYLQIWNKLKYEKIGKEFIPYPLERIRKRYFKYDEYLNNNQKYDFNIEALLYSMAEVDEYEEDQKLIKKPFKILSSLDEYVSKLVVNRFNQKKGLDFKKAKMFYHMFKLNYIDYNNEFVKNLNFALEPNSKEGKIIKENSAIYEFLLGKYEYMFENNLFTVEDKNNLWEIMNKFTRRIDKIVDERIYAFFNYVFNNYSLGALEFIFEYDFYKYPIDFVADMYFLYHQDLPKLRSETKMFINSKTEELLAKIFLTDENVILDLNYLIFVMKLYYTTNGILQFNYYNFNNDYTDKIYECYMNILEKCDTKHKRNALFNIYTNFFDVLNDNLPLLKSTLQKMGLCIKEFTSPDKSTIADKGNNILKKLELAFQSFTGNIHFPSLCDEIVDILNKENDRNDTNKMVYLQAVNSIYQVQKHLYISKYSSQEIFDSLFKVFSAIKKEELKRNFSSVFLSYFNDLTEEENIKFIEKYEKYIFDNNENNKNRYNYIYILMNQLMRFKIRIPEYLQKFIIKLKIVNTFENDKLKKIIIDLLKKAMSSYRGSYIFMKENISEECKEVLEEMTRDKTYFV